jgi:hypothetical protein
MQQENEAQLRRLAELTNAEVHLVQFSELKKFYNRQTDGELPKKSLVPNGLLLKWAARYAKENGYAAVKYIDEAANSSDNGYERMIVVIDKTSCKLEKHHIRVGSEVLGCGMYVSLTPEARKLIGTVKVQTVKEAA